MLRNDGCVWRPVCVALMLAVAAPVHAAETLSDAWAAALESHQQLAAAEAELDMARFGLAGARAERLPRLDVSGGYTQLDSAPRFSFGEDFISPRIFPGDRISMANAQVSLPVYTGGAVSRGIDAARSQTNAADRQVDAVRADIKLGAAMHYVAALRAESALAVVRSNVATLESITADAENRFNLGAVARNDYLAASVQLASGQQRELHAENQLALAHATYNRYLGRPQDANVSLDRQLNVTSLLPALGNLETLLALALDERPEVGSMAARAAALRAQAAAQRAQTRPQLMLTSNYTRLETTVLDDDEFWMVGLAVRWSLFDAGRNRNRVSAIRSEAQAAEHRLRDISADIALEVRGAWFDLQEAEQRIRVVEAAVTQAGENLRVARDRYRSGANTNSEVLDAQALLEQALNNRDDTNFDAAIANLRLARASGQL